MLVVLTQSAEEATSMDDATRLLGLTGFRVVSVAPDNDDAVHVVVETVEAGGGAGRLSRPRPAAHHGRHRGHQTCATNSMVRPQPRLTCSSR